MIPLPEAWSYSALNQFLRVCGLQYFFDRVEHLEPEELSSNPILGSALHHAHAFARSHQKRGARVELADLKDVFRDSWGALASDPRVRFEEGERERLLADGERYVEVLHANLGDEQVLAVEQEWMTELVDPATGEVLPRPLKGVFDLVVRDHEGRIVIVDLKTAASRYSESRVEHDLQATVYSYAASQLYPYGARFRFDLIIKRARPTFERIYATRDERSFRRLVALVESAERAMAAGVFVPNDGSFYCSGCGYRSACAGWTGERSARHMPADATA